MVQTRVCLGVYSTCTSRESVSNCWCVKYSINYISSRWCVQVFLYLFLSFKFFFYLTCNPGIPLQVQCSISAGASHVTDQISVPLPTLPPRVDPTSSFPLVLHTFYYGAQSPHCAGDTDPTEPTAAPSCVLCLLIPPLSMPPPLTPPRLLQSLG